MARGGGGGGVGSPIAREAARIYVEEALTDFGAAKRKAAERLGLGTRTGLPDNASVQAEVVAYQRLFGGSAYVEQLLTLRKAAVAAMQLLERFNPRLVGSTVTGAISRASRVQLHAFPSKPELVDVFLAERRIEMTADERDYRWPNGSVSAVPLARFEWAGAGVDVALFGAGEDRQAPLSPADGKPARRLSLAAAQLLAEEAIALI